MQTSLDVEGERGEGRCSTPCCGHHIRDSNKRDSIQRGEGERRKGQRGKGEHDTSDTSGSGGGAGETDELPHEALVTLVSDDDDVPSPLTAADELYLLPPHYLENQVRGEKSRLLRVLLAKTPDAGEELSPAGGDI